ncbi:MAG: FAD-dependent oxidoreductase [Acidimicrobiia bacterium]|nr:FAD-dependent oxidoreductase [Acidimicrobiia bacterium]
MVTDTESRADVAVLGAGPAGLAAGLFAARRGHSVVVVERAAVVGGLAGSFDVAGVRVDHGSHRLHPSTDGDLLSELRAHLGEELQIRARHGRIRLEGRWLAFPLRPLDLLTNAPSRLVAGAAIDLASAPLRRRRAGRASRPDSFAERARAGLGPTITARFYAPYARKLWGVTADELDGELYRRRVSAGSGGRLVRRILRAGGSDRPTFLYPAGGFGRISEALAEAFVGAGGELRLGAPVTALRASPDGASTTVELAGRETIEPTTVLSTLPITTVADLADDVPPEVGTAARSLDSRGAVLVYLVVPRRPYTEFDAHYFPDPANPVARLSEPANYRASAADPGDRTVLCAELPATPGDAVWSTGDDALGRLVATSLVVDGLPDPSPTEVVVRRVPFVYPVYRLGYGRHLATLERWAASRPGLVVLGRQGLFAHDNTHHGMAMGRAAAACVRDDGTLDEPAWAAARASFREHVVED